VVLPPDQAPFPAQTSREKAQTPLRTDSMAHSRPITARLVNTRRSHGDVPSISPSEGSSGQASSTALYPRLARQYLGQLTTFGMTLICLCMSI